MSIEDKVVKGFGDEWNKFDQRKINDDKLKKIYEKYFSIFPWRVIGENSVGFDMGCGSGRWAKFIAPKVKKLYCIEPSSALKVAKRNLRDFNNCFFESSTVATCSLKKDSMDFGYSLGVLHHIPKTANAIKECVSFLKPKAPFLLYLYYDFDNKNFIYRYIWKVSELGRFVISRLPFKVRYLTSQLLAFFIYLPLARFSLFCEKLGFNKKFIEAIPLSFYRDLDFYSMRTDALDRFGTILEQRFSKKEIKIMMKDAGLENIIFSESSPYWCALGFKKN
jgi:SAM-dependent methyltransferase